MLVTAGEGAGSAATAYAINLVGGSHTIKGRFSNNYGTQTAKIDSRRIVALWLSTTPGSQPTNNFAFADGTSKSIGTSETIVATLSTSSFDSGNNFVIAVVQFSSTAATNIATGKLRLTRANSTLMSNAYTVRLGSGALNNQKWFALMAFDSGAPQNPTYDVRATAAATGISGEAKILAISGLTGASAQGSSTAIGATETTLTTLSTSLPAGDNVVLAIIESQNTATSIRYLSALNLKSGSTTPASAEYRVNYSSSSTAEGAWQVQLIPYMDADASASAQYTVTATASSASVVYGRATIVAFSRGSLLAAYSDGGSVGLGTGEITINYLGTTFSSGTDVAVIASEQFDDTSSATTIAAGNDKLQQNGQATGQTVNQYIIRIPGNSANDDGKGFGLLNEYTNVPASPEYEVKATAAAAYVNGESKILALAKPPKVPEFPLGPALVLAVCSPILLAVRYSSRRSRRV